MFDLGQHIPGDRIAAELPLGQSGLLPGKEQLFAQFHRIFLRVIVIYRIVSYFLPFFHRYKKFICYFPLFGL